MRSAADDARIEQLRKYLDILKSDQCQCGQYKQPKMAFCYRGCWKRLPGKMQRALYQNIGDGFEEAYDGALAFLKGESNG